MGVVAHDPAPPVLAERALGSRARASRSPSGGSRSRSRSGRPCPCGRTARGGRAVRSGSSIGWVVSHTCSRMTSEGRRSSFGASDPSSSNAVHPPHERREPGDAALDEHDPQLRELLEDALEHQAGQLVLERGRHPDLVLEVEAGEAGAGQRPPYCRVNRRDNDGLLIADCSVQMPVPFCPALSRMTSTSGLPVSGSILRKICEVMSMR